MNPFPGMALTGTGVVAPAGFGKNDFFGSFRDSGRLERESGRWLELEPGQLLKHLNIPEPKLKIARYMDPVSKNAIVAVGGAVTDARLDADQIAAAPHEYGIVLGTTRGACLTRKNLHESLASRQGKTVSATVFSHCGYNIAGAMAAIAFGMKGPNLAIAGRADLGIPVLRRVWQIMAARRAHTVFAGFTECDGRRTRRNGFFGEWAYALCLERKDTAAKRGAAVLAEVSMEPADDATSRGGSAFGLPSRDAPIDGNAAALALPSQGMKTIGDRYASLIVAGYLAHDRSLKERFPAVAFVPSAGNCRTAVKLFYGGRT